MNRALYAKALEINWQDTMNVLVYLCSMLDNNLMLNQINDLPIWNWPTHVVILSVRVE